VSSRFHGAGQGAGQGIRQEGDPPLKVVPL